MRTRKVIALSLISAGAAVLFSGCPAQPPGPCVVARTGAIAFEGADGSPYAVQYYFQNEAAGSDCAAAAVADPAIAAFPTGNFTGALWAEAYGEVTASKKLVAFVPEEFGWTNTYGNNAGLADYVECSPLNNAIYAAETPPGPVCANSPLILGNFTTDVEDVNGSCTVQGTAAGVQTVDGVLVSYTYSSSLIYVTAAAGEGTQIQASVSISRQSALTASTCVRNYVAIGLWPSTVCNVDNDCNPNPQPSNTPPRPIGSGILTGIPVSCNLGFVAQDPVIVPGADMDEFGCGTADAPFIIQTGGCGGGAHDNNGTGGTNMCFFSGAGPTTFPYVSSTN